MNEILRFAEGAVVRFDERYEAALIIVTPNDTYRDMWNASRAGIAYMDVDGSIKLSDSQIRGLEKKHGGSPPYQWQLYEDARS